LPGQIVELELRDAPEGWDLSFQGGGREVSSVYAKPETPTSVTLRAEVPENATGSFEMTVVARGASRTAQLPLVLTIGEAAPPSLRLDPDLPIIQGAPSANLSFRVTVANEGDTDLLVNLSADSPEGFNVSFRQNANEVSTVPIEAGQTATVDMQVRAPAEIAAGEYKFTMHAQAADVADEVELTALLRGQPSLSLSAADGRLSGRANAGTETPLELVLVNDGTAPAENVTLSASPPTNWSVRIEPEVVASVAPGEEVTVTAYITPPDQAIAGDYVVTVRSRPEDGTSESVEFRITVVTSTLWGVVGLVLVAAALAVVAVAVGRFGRR
jgi:uncharacterized membrane protein